LDRHKLTAFHDLFAGGGSIPLEAQRLGLESYASDLNPVAVLINKAVIEISPKFAGKPPVHSDARRDPQHFKKEWKGRRKTRVITAKGWALRSRDTVRCWFRPPTAAA
jgi:putative DNA methylase